MYSVTSTLEEEFKQDWLNPGSLVNLFEICRSHTMCVGCLPSMLPTPPSYPLCYHSHLWYVQLCISHFCLACLFHKCCWHSSSLDLLKGVGPMVLQYWGWIVQDWVVSREWPAAWLHGIRVGGMCLENGYGVHLVHYPLLAHRCNTESTLHERVSVVPRRTLLMKQGRRSL